MTNNIISGNYKGIFLVCIGSPTDVIRNLFENNKQIGLRFWSSRPQDSILQNNFINNRRHASFVSALTFNGFTYDWRGNYWGEPRSESFRIWGRFYLIFGIIPFPWINYDMYPAQEPNDITPPLECGV
jgi:nitrous oxidase accessory protein NosD